MKVAATFDNIEINFEADTVQSVIEILADAQTVLRHEPCGLCGSPSELRYRTPQGYKYYERACTNHQCGAVLQFGQMKDSGRLYAKRFDENGAIIGTNGWHKYTNKKQQGDQHHEQSGQTKNPTQATAGRPPDNPASAGKTASAKDPTRAYFETLTEEAKAAVMALPLTCRRTFCKRAAALEWDHSDVVSMASLHKRLIERYKLGDPDAKGDYEDLCTSTGDAEESWRDAIKSLPESKDEFFDNYVRHLYDPFLYSEETVLD